MRWIVGLCLAIASLSGTAAVARIPLEPRLYAGAEAGFGTRSVRLDPGSERIAGHRSDAGVSYGLFAGVEQKLPAGLFVAAEADGGRSEARPSATQFRGVQLPGSVRIGVVDVLRVRSRWNYSLTARAGVSPLPGLGIYGLAGYGAERLRFTRTSGIASPGVQPTAVDVRRTCDGAAYGGGARYRLGRFGARVEYRRTASCRGSDPQQLLGGVFVTF